MNKKDYTIINNAKNTIPEFGDTFEKCKKEHYKTLSIASHELLNHISFLNSSYDLISKTYPETKICVSGIVWVHQYMKSQT